MSKAYLPAGLLMLAMALTACNHTGSGEIAAEVAADLDPTGISATALTIARSARPETIEQDVDFSAMAPRLKDVAAGSTARPNFMGAVDQKIGLQMARHGAGMASTVGRAAIGSAMGSTPTMGTVALLAMQGSAAGANAAQMAAARGQVSSSVAVAEAERAANRIIPDEDRAAEAQALLSIADGSAGKSAAWHNPETGASGKVTIRAADKAMFGDLDCRLVKQEWKSGKAIRTGNMTICRSRGEWYDLS